MSTKTEKKHMKQMAVKARVVAGAPGKSPRKPVKGRAHAAPVPGYVNVGKLIEPHHIDAVGKHVPRGLKNAISIKALGRRMRCSKGAAERRLNAWMNKNRGMDKKIRFVPVRDGDRGPLSTGFYLG